MRVAPASNPPADFLDGPVKASSGELRYWIEADTRQEAGKGGDTR